MVYIKVILALIPLLKEIVDWVRELTTEDPAKFISDLHEAIIDVKATKDPKKLQDLVKRL